jgi:hypothetical protein
MYMKCHCAALAAGLVFASGSASSQTLKQFVGFGDTFNVWVTGDVASLKMNSGSEGFPNDPGTPAAVTAGVDYAFANGLLVGGAVSYGQTTRSFRKHRPSSRRRWSGAAARCPPPSWCSATSSHRCPGRSPAFDPSDMQTAGPEKVRPHGNETGCRPA